MSTATTVTTSTDARPRMEAPVYPSTSAEFINVFAHYHRAEIARMPFRFLAVSATGVRSASSFRSRVIRRGRAQEPSPTSNAGPVRRM